MPFVDTNSHLTTKPSNFDTKFQGNSESYDRHGFLGIKFEGGHSFFFIFIVKFLPRERVLRS